MGELEATLTEAEFWEWIAYFKIQKENFDRERAAKK